MSIEKINPAYTLNSKADGDTLEHGEWNEISEAVATAHDKINDIIDDINVSVADETESGGDPKVGVSIASGVQEVGSPKVIELTKKSKGVNISIVSDNNINIEPREAHGTGSEKNDNNGNMKGGNISLKPGDDIELCSHHRGSDKSDEVNVKVIDGNDNPVKLQVNLSEITLTTKDKQGQDSDVLDLNVNRGKNQKGYLKVRAQAIDLRCEDHGGVALQPKGYDGQSHMNKIKFEHGGGDGLEFGTFNTEKSSLYTNEYRFKKNGILKLATRAMLDNTPESGDGNGKYDGIDETTHYSYQKQADDFYDIVDRNDPTCTWEDLIALAAWAKANNFGPWSQQS